LRRHAGPPAPSGATILSTDRHERPHLAQADPRLLHEQHWLEVLRFEVLDQIEALGGFDGAVLEGQRPCSVALDVLEAEIDALDVEAARYRGDRVPGFRPCDLAAAHAPTEARR
jgi:hypothetical protein